MTEQNNNAKALAEDIIYRLVGANPTDDSPLTAELKQLIDRHTDKAVEAATAASSGLTFASVKAEILLRTWSHPNYKKVTNTDRYLAKAASDDLTKAFNDLIKVKGI